MKEYHTCRKLSVVHLGGSIMKAQRPHTYLLIAIGLLALAYACTTPQTTPTSGQGSPIVEIDRETHFLTPAGEDVVVFPGAYMVQVEKEGLRLIAEEGTSSESVVIEAASQTHDQKLTGPTAISISEKEDEQVIVLLMPDGKGWEAIGSHSGVISRAAPRPRTPQSRIQQAITLRNQLLVQTQQISLIRTSVRYQALNETYTGALVKNTWRLPVSDTLDNGQFSFSWAGYTAGQSLQSLPKLNTVPEISQLVSKQQCCIQLLINGKAMKGTTLNFGKDGSLMTRVNMPFSQSKTWPKTVKLVITKDNKKWESSDTKIYANPVSYYAKVLHPIFSNPRCTTCHALGDHNAIVAMHQSRIGAANYPYENEPEAKPQNPTFCANCHTVPDWRSPNFAQGIHWEGKNAGQVCSTVTGPFIDGAGTQHPPFGSTEFQHHFHDDPRILWAVSDGATPFGTTLPTPFPGNTNSWFSKVDPWVAAGTPCPQKLYFQLPGRIQPGQLVPRGR